MRATRTQGLDKSVIDALGLRSRSVAVEHNGEAVARSRYTSVRLRDGDVVEVVRAVPGG